MEPEHNLANVDSLINKLDREISWRRKEISSIKNLSVNSVLSSEISRRAFWVLLCAHWEGFLKKSIKIYIDYVFSLNLKINELRPEFVAIAFFDDVVKAGQASYPGSKNHHVKLANRIAENIELGCTQSNWTVNTEGNATSEVLVRLIDSACLPSQLGLHNATWSTMTTFIDRQLLKIRNQIAHGEGTPISFDELSQASQRVDILLNQVLDQILYCVSYNTFKLNKEI